MHELNLLDETLDINQTPSYHLSIQVSLNGLSYVILDLVRNKYVALRHYEIPEGLEENAWLNKIEEILREDEFLLKEFRSAYFMYSSARFTLIPSPLFRKEDLRMYFEFNQKIEEFDELHYNRLKLTDAYLVFPLPGELGNIITRHFPHVAFYHQGVPLIEHFLSAPGKKSSETRVSLHVHRELFDLVVHSGKKLSFFNTFRYTHPNDLLFFVMYVIDQLKLDPAECELMLSGMISKASEHHNLLKKYIRNIRFDKPSEQYGYTYTFSDIPIHSFVNLLNLHACAS